MASPFYQDTQYQFAWNSSAMGTFKQCPRLYQYKYILGYSPKGSGLHIRFGSLYHEALERYDRLILSGADADSAIDAVVQFLLLATWDGRDPEGGGGAPWETGDTKKNRETLIRSVVWYIDHYNPDPARTFILDSGEPAIELAFAVELPFLTPVGEPYLYTGHIDRMVTYGDDLMVTDRKTTGAAIGGFYFDKFKPDNQMSGYIYAGRVGFSVPISGVMIDVAQIQVGATNFGRGFTTRSEAELDEWLADMRVYTEMSVRYADAGYWPMNDKACWGCDFRRVCGADPSLRENHLRTDFEIDRHSIERIMP